MHDQNTTKTYSYLLKPVGVIISQGRYTILKFVMNVKMIIFLGVLFCTIYLFILFGGGEGSVLVGEREKIVVPTRALYRIAIYRLYRYFGYTIHITSFILVT